ncbi:hypothetical protein CEE45_10800 [Candidatus Heimdallarchaeota archaeon B3_Heim]|nr:MAG: hypothetical protein CEE45_10800 [Candidatus Heimdallarchaeota archaeon B3_Heim]
MNGLIMSNENETESVLIEHPLLVSLILTFVYGFAIYLPDYLDLENVFFTNPSPFERISFEFVSRFTLSGLLWIFVVPISLYLMKGLTSRDFLRTIRLHPNQISSRSILLGLTVSISFFICVVLTAMLLGVYTSNFSLLTSPDYENGLGWFIFVFALIPGIWEEIAFRGIIFSFLLSRYSVGKALLLDSVLFSLFHIFNYLLLNQDLSSVLFQSIAAIPVGLSLAYLVVKTDSILPAILIHYSIDVTLFISGFIFDLSNTSSTLIFALLSLIVIPPFLILLFSWIFSSNGKDHTTDLKGK